MQFVDDDSEGAITSYVASGTERVHCDIKGNDECLCVRREAQDASHWTQGSHYSSTRYTRCCYHTDSQKHDEMEEKWQVVRQSANETDGESAAGNLHH